ncbi:MAG TPA: hypothetical protein VKX46_07785 [Ktedonobacteraceae bacterium]|nr:hypothetical protein [Ktedonobacteraceae bacterium]
MEYDTNQPTQGNFMDNPLHSVRQGIENQIGQAIDHYASQVPGGERYSPEAKKAVSGILDGLQQQLENEAASRLGGLGGGMFGGNGNMPASQGNLPPAQGDNGSLL